MERAVARYRESDVTTASPGEVLIKLLDHARRNTQLAIKAVDERRLADKGVAIGKALAILGELSSSFDEAKAPEVAVSVRVLYQFIRDKLLEGTSALTVEPLNDALRIIEHLRETWVQAVLKARSEGAAV
ncbi:MAG: flagellar export chaperone FliS [Myxococcota bacterium]